MCREDEQYCVRGGWEEGGGRLATGVLAAYGLERYRGDKLF